MDQDAFRKLLSTPKQNGSHNAPSRGSWLSKAKEDQKKTAAASADTSKPAFKPRKVKKQSDFGYRDRAAERRTGVAGDFAEVESVLETFEKQHANEDKEIVEEQRKYLGGDSEHTVLVKGLDFALLEQTKARLAARSSTKDDEELEEAFRGAISGSPPALEEVLPSKKRTREDIVRELKNKKTKSEANGGDATAQVVDKSIEEAKKEGKFKPIGFKPIGGSNSKAKDGKEKEVKKKKKRKVEGNAAAAQTTATSSAGAGAKKVDEPSGLNVMQDSDKEPLRPVPASTPEPEPLNEDFDIFAGAGEYEGIDLGDDDEDDSVNGDSSRERKSDSPSETHSPEVSRQEQTERRDDEQQNEPRPNRKWIEDGEELDKSPSTPPDRRLPIHADAKGKHRATTPHLDEPPSSDVHSEHEVEPDSKPESISRLAPLASSSIPSIQDILAADAAREAEEKRKARKEKQKNKRGGGGGEGGGEKKKVSAEAKINRDYQKLKSYTAKKGGGLGV
ncbi:hypothetical protein ACEPAH_3553 [Sanghuangporus vaninii]